jgi:hypothetical protein
MCVCGVESGSEDFAGTAAAGVGTGGVTAFCLPWIMQPALAVASKAATIGAQGFMRNHSSYYRQTDQKCRALAGFAREIDCTIVQLYDSERHG